MHNPTKYLFIIAALVATTGQAQQAATPQPAQVSAPSQAQTNQPANPQTQPCTPLEFYQHVHIEKSKAANKFFARLNSQIDKATGGLASGPRPDEVAKALPPPCPAQKPAIPPVTR